jgi:ribonuclease P protein component
MNADESPSSFAFPRRRRLSGLREFARVFGGRHSAGNKFLIVYAISNDRDESRLGLSVGRRCGNAVCRNYLKRLLREAFRLEFANLPAGFDFVCVPRPGTKLTLDETRRSLIAVAERAAKRATSQSV